MTGGRYAAVVLAGGAARRLGGARKPALAVGGRPMLQQVLDAVADARPRVVVGPPDLPLPAGVDRTLEQPPGGGPVAAAAAGLALVPAGTPYVALLAADLPFLTREAVALLREAAGGGDDDERRRGDEDRRGSDDHGGGDGDGDGVDGAVFVDSAGRPQWLCGVWRTGALVSKLGTGRPGTALRTVLGGLRTVRVRAAPAAGRLPPWYDCDTEADLRRGRDHL